ncbi:MAG: hypothetical protein IKC40_08040 [Oscillospiraceae bacterium]|nr:hypothetical protein [Oscillospiraceae bacterium]MBR6617972.1 hypothetical protein [Oscillospiraceae bacterium]
MKHYFKSITAGALAMLFAMGTFPTFSANAVYKDSSEIAFSLRAIETEGCGYLARENTVYVSPTAAQNGTSVRIGMYIEAEYADIAILNMKLQSNTEEITFNKESFYNPDTDYSDAPITYTMEDGTQFSSKKKPYCFGMINRSGLYRDNCSFLTPNFPSDENSFNLMWMHAMEASDQTSATFLGSRSDEYSFVEVELDIAPDTEPGEYQIFFVTDDGSDMGATYLTSDDTVNSEEGSVYNDIVPTLKDLQIVIPCGAYFIEEDPVAYRWLDDTTPLQSEDFYPEGTIVYEDTENGYLAQPLDYQKFHTGVNGMTIQFLTDPDEFICGNYFESYYDGQEFSTPMYYTGGYLFSTVRSGLRGDANRDNMVNAMDAAAILSYAAVRGAGGTDYLNDSLHYDLSYFLADVNEGSTCCGNGDGTSLDAMDASAILTYAAEAGTGVVPDWNEILK